MGSLRDRTVTPSFSCDSHKVFLMTIATSVSVMTVEDFRLASHVFFVFVFVMVYAQFLHNSTQKRHD